MKRVLGWIVGVLLAFSGTALAETVIIVHSDVPETTVSLQDVQEIFLGKRVQWQDNSAIHPAMVKDADLHGAFLEQYIKKTVSKWNAHWKRLVFTGTGTPPQQFETEQELMEYVATTKGAIGYVDSETVVENVNIIAVE